MGMLLLPLVAMLLFSIIINTLLFAFNLLPIPPLDGGRILLSSLPLKPAMLLSRLEPYGMLVIHRPALFRFTDSRGQRLYRDDLPIHDRIHSLEVRVVTDCEGVNDACGQRHAAQRAPAPGAII